MWARATPTPTRQCHPFSVPTAASPALTPTPCHPTPVTACRLLCAVHSLRAWRGVVGAGHTGRAGAGQTQRPGRCAGQAGAAGPVHRGRAHRPRRRRRAHRARVVRRVPQSVGQTVVLLRLAVGADDRRRQLGGALHRRGAGARNERHDTLHRRYGGSVLFRQTRGGGGVVRVQRALCPSGRVCVLAVGVELSSVAPV